LSASNGAVPDSGEAYWRTEQITTVTYKNVVVAVVGRLLSSVFFRKYSRLLALDTNHGIDVGRP